MTITPKAFDGSGFSVDLVDADKFNVFEAAQAGSLPAIAQVSDSVAHFKSEARADTTTAATTVIDLSAKGCTFAAGTIRLVKARAYFKGTGTTTKLSYSEKWALVTGGTTPTINAAGAGRVSLMAIPGGGFTTSEPVLDIIMVANAVCVQMTTGGAEVINALIEVKVEKSVIIPFGV